MLGTFLHLWSKVTVRSLRPSFCGALHNLFFDLKYKVLQRICFCKVFKLQQKHLATVSVFVGMKRFSLQLKLNDRINIRVKRFFFFCHQIHSQSYACDICSHTAGQAFSLVLPFPFKLCILYQSFVKIFTCFIAKVKAVVGPCGSRDATLFPYLFFQLVPGPRLLRVLILESLCKIPGQRLRQKYLHK